MRWQVFAAAVAGSSHKETGLPCQDAFAHRVDGEVLCAAVCDGAGSAAKSDEGAKRLADGVVQRLGRAVMFGELKPDAPRERIESAVQEAVADARRELDTLALLHSVPLSALACTLVGVVASPQGGWFFHIGDGLAVAEACDEGLSPSLSLPENGEYANETYFVTGDAWREHLRCSAIAGPLRHVVLMSDGAAPFVMAKGHAGLFRPFIDPVLRYLGGASSHDGNKALATTLADPRIDSITADDKTLLIAQWR
jgi:hypothetical protein